MPRIDFTPNLRRHVACAAMEVEAATVREALERAFAANPALRPYILDEQGRLRRHMNVFIGGRMAADRIGLSDTVAPDDDILVFQALSGG